MFELFPRGCINCWIYNSEQVRRLLASEILAIDVRSREVMTLCDKDHGRRAYRMLGNKRGGISRNFGVLVKVKSREMEGKERRKKKERGGREERWKLKKHFERPKAMLRYQMELMTLGLKY